MDENGPFEHSFDNAIPTRGLMTERRGRNRTAGRWIAGAVIAILIVAAVVVAVGLAGIPPIRTDHGPAMGGPDGNETNEMDATTTDNTATTTDTTVTVDNTTVIVDNTASTTDNTATTTDNTAHTTRDTTSTGSAATETVILDYTIEQVPEPGLVRVTVTVESSATLTGLEIHLPSDAEYVRRRGLARYLFDWPNEWTVNGSAATPSITYIASVNDTDAGYIESVDVGEWALFDVTVVGVELDWSGVDNATEMMAVRTVHVSGQGVAGPGFAYLGPYRDYSRAVANGSIHLIVPKAATMVADRDTVLSQLAFAATELRVGERDEQVNVYVAPAPIETIGFMYAIEYNGTQGVLVHQNSTISTYDNAWLHEYVHTRQNYTLGKKMRWFDEASAEYYAALLTYHSVLRTGYEDWVLFHKFHWYVTPRLFSDTVLANVGPRPTAAMYFKGMRVLAALDARIRLASNGENTLEDVFRRMNTHEGVVTYEDFQAFVADAAGQSLDGWLNRYIRTSATPPVPQNSSLFADVQQTTGNASRPPETVGKSGATSHRRGERNHMDSLLTESTAFEWRKNDSRTGLSSRSLLADRHVDVAICNLNGHH